MLTIIYSEEGISCSDFEAEEYVDCLIENYRFSQSYNEKFDGVINISSELIINYFRIAILEGQIDIGDIKFKYKEVEFNMNKNGLFEQYPEGFCEKYLKSCSKLLDLRIENC